MVEYARKSPKRKRKSPARRKSPKKSPVKARRKSPRKSPKNCTLKQLEKAVFSLKPSLFESGSTQGLIATKDKGFIKKLKNSQTKKDCLFLLRNPKHPDNIEFIDEEGYNYANYKYGNY